MANMSLRPLAHGLGLWVLLSCCECGDDVVCGFLLTGLRDLRILR